MVATRVRTFEVKFNRMARLTPPPFLVKIATGRNVVLLLVLFFSFSMGIMPALEADIKALSGGIGVIDLQIFYNPEKARAMLEAYGPEGRHLYLIAQWTVDLIFPAIGCFLFATLLIWLGARRWWWLGLCLCTMDWLENVAVTWMLVRYPEFQPQVSWTSCLFTMAKWGSIAFTLLLVLFYGGRRLFRPAGKRQSMPA